MDHDARRRLLRALPTALHALAVPDPGVGSTGAHATLVSWVTQVSAEPPLVAVALEVEGTTLPLVRAADVFTLAPLPATARALAQRLGRRGVEDPAKSEAIAFDRTPTAGMPVVRGAVGWLACRVRALHHAGDHTLVIGEIVEAAMGAGDAAVLTVEATGWRY